MASGGGRGGGILGQALTRGLVPILGLALALALALAAGPGRAEGEGFEEATGQDALAHVGVAALHVGEVRSCSALLVSPDLALTAAHCVEGRDPSTIRLAPGGGAAWLQVTALALPGDHRPGVAALRLADLASDLALLRLDPAGAIAPVEPLPVVAWPHPAGEFVDILGYPREGSGALMRREGCAVLSEEAGVVTLACDVVSGLSGAGVFRQLPEGAAPELVALVVARSPGRAYALVLAGRAEALRALLPAR